MARLSEETKHVFGEGYQGSQASRNAAHEVDGLERMHAQAGIDQAAAYANDPKNRTRNSAPQKKKRFDTAKLLAKAKKSTPLVVVLGLLGVGGLGIGIFFGPAMAVVNFREVISSHLNDTSAIYNGRKAKVIKSKMTSSMGHCGPTVSVRCKFSSMSGRQLRAFQRAGIQVQCQGGPCRTGSFARNQVASLSFADSGRSNQRVNIDSNNLHNIDRIMRSNPNVQRALWNAYNPNFMSMSTSAARNAMNRLGITKAKTISGNNRDQMSQQLNNRVNNRTGQASADGVRAIDTEGGRQQAQVDADNQRATQMQQQINNSRGTSARLVRGVSVLGGTDDICMIYNTSRALQVLSKGLRYARLAAFAMSMLSVADSIKAGTATAEEVAYVGDRLTEPDMRETLADDIPDNLDLGEGSQSIPNPEYGQTATDSAIYRAAAYGDPVNPAQMSTANSSFMTGGFGMGVLGTLSAITGELLTNPRVVCGFVQNPLVRGGSILLGTIASASGIGLAITAITAVVQYQGVNAAITALEDQVIRETEEIDYDAEARHGQFTAAMYSGTGAVHGSVAQNSGAMPVTEEEFDDFAYMHNDYMQTYVAMETMNARENPFDVYNQFSFAGQAARTLSSLTQNATSTASKISSIVSGSFASLTNTSYAATELNPQHYEVCDDEDYAELGIKADFMCNMRHGLTQAEMAMETSDVVEFMVASGHIEDEVADGADVEQVAASDEYHDFLRWCVNRAEAFGTQGAEQDLLGRGGENAWTTGENCLGQGDLDSAALSNFKVFTVDYTLMQSMDYDVGLSDGGGGVASANARMGSVPVTSDGWSYPAEGPQRACGFDCYSNHRGMDVTTMNEGDDIHAVREGVVIHAGVDTVMTRQACLSLGLGDIWRGANYTVLIRHTIDGQSYESRYSHLRPDSIAVREGERVRGGQVVGQVGMTGCTTGPHAHIDIATPNLNNYYSNTIDPTTIFGRVW